MPRTSQWHWFKGVLAVFVLGLILHVDGDTFYVKTDCSGTSNCYDTINSTLFDSLSDGDTIEIESGVFDIEFDISTIISTK